MQNVFYLQKVFLIPVLIFRMIFFGCLHDFRKRSNKILLPKAVADGNACHLIFAEVKVRSNGEWRRFSPKIGVCFRKQFVSIGLNKRSGIEIGGPLPTENFRSFYAKHTPFDAETSLSGERF